ncbi:MAG: S9 family peptidase [Blastocatellia bacterium]
MKTKSPLSIRFLFACAILCAVAITSITSLHAQTKRVITHEDVWLMKRVGAPAPSPDGKWVLFSVIEPAYDEKDQVSDLWVAPADGSAPPRRFTNTKGGESGATWAPDGLRIAFAARREGDEAAQIYIQDLGGGDARRVTSVSTGARAPQFSPDGKQLLFVSNVFPGAINDADNRRIAAERRARKWNARVYEGFPIRNWDKWMDDLQPHVFVQALEPGAQAKDILAETSLVREKGFAGRTADGGQEIDAIWTPGGQSIVFVASADRHTSAYARSHTRLYMIGVDNGKLTQLTPDNLRENYVVSASRPRFSPDGKALYCLVEPQTNKVYNLDRLARMSWPMQGRGMEPGYVMRTSDFQILTESFDRSVSSFAPAADGKVIWLSAEDAGLEKIYQLPVTGGTPAQLKIAGKGAYTSLAVPGKGAGLFALWESAVNPAEAVRIVPDGNGHTNLSSFNHERIASLDLQPMRHFSFTSKRGKAIHNMLVLPPGFDESKKYPLFVIIHGGPHSMWRDQFFLRWNYHLLTAAGYVGLLTNYTGSTGFGEKFAQEIQGDPLKGPGEEINEAADEAIKRFAFIDGARQAAGGASYGGHLANWLQGTTTRYKCLISHAGLVNLEVQWGTSDTIYSREMNSGGPVWEQGAVWREQNPIRLAANFKTPMLITVGEHDFRVPLNNSLENWSVHQRLKIPSKLLVFPEENHWILKGENSRFWYGEVRDWLGKWVK